jgi:hypothetical protein
MLAPEMQIWKKKNIRSEIAQTERVSLRDSQVNEPVEYMYGSCGTREPRMTVLARGSRNLPDRKGWPESIIKRIWRMSK